MSLDDISEADEAGRSPAAALGAYAEQILKGESMGVIDMYERAARRAGCDGHAIEIAREQAKALVPRA